ncbi:MAG: hypothetical protein DMF49_06155, partial [Acidobacteria bacterium]
MQTWLDASFFPHAPRDPDEGSARSSSIIRVLPALSLAVLLQAGIAAVQAGVTIDLSLSSNTKDQREVLGATPADKLG